MKNARKILLVTVILFCLSLSSCTQDFATKDFEFTDKQSYEKGCPFAMEYGVLYSEYITESYLEEYPFVDGYYGYYRHENFYFPMCTTSFFGFDVKIPLFDIAVDERLLLYFQYDKETYQRVKVYLAENLRLSEAPTHEYNGYVFYDSFTNQSHTSKRDPHNFNSLVYNDANNTIILLGLYYNNDNNELYSTDYDWHEYLEVVYGGWYDFSQKLF